jgi:hypothetical protein
MKILYLRTPLPRKKEEWQEMLKGNNNFNYVTRHYAIQKTYYDGCFTQLEPL